MMGLGLVDAQVYIVNITSLMAVRSFPYWSLYSMAKTGRNAYIKCMALEQV
jgi:NAD(P)-dependent dehydrogenase (short-subunit alcohol dehydrogenase family)